MPSVQQKVNSNFKQFLFELSKQYKNVAWLDSHNEVNTSAVNDKSLLLALGKKSDFTLDNTNNLAQFQHYCSKGKHLFGFVSYDLKNEIDVNLKSDNHDGLQFPLLYFFEPELLIELSNDEVSVTADDNEVITAVLSQDLSRFQLNDESNDNLNIISNTKSNKNTNTKSSLNSEVKSGGFSARLSKDEYLKKVEAIKHKIAKGDIYEMNFCYEFFAEHKTIEPYAVYKELANYSPTPFASFFRNDDQYILCASPERFLKKTGQKITSQPIKGTAKRGATAEEDEKLKLQLLNSSKERSENVMIVDLVRNDLAQIAKDSSVKVDELFGIYTFPQVHQMISTVSCELKSNTSLVEIFKKCFPMGSMTGAPKISAIKLIEEFENSKRGVYSGSIGYITPSGDFDFNVVIRSLLFNKAKDYLSFSVGSAITYHSIPEEEYEETLLKAKAIFEVFSS